MYSCSVLWKFFTSALVPAGTLDTLSALNAPRCPKASQGLTRSLWAEMVFPDDVHPVPKKATRCSHQEVKAERDAKAKAIEERIQKLEMVKHLLAEANAVEDIKNSVWKSGYETGKRP